MRILLSHRFYWPDTAPYGLMLRMIGTALARDGHEVHVFSTPPSYRAGADAGQEAGADGLRVRRIAVFRREKDSLPKRLANVALYSGGLFVRVLRLRPDVVTASSYPPVLAAWSASLAARLVAARFVYHVQDIHPEVSAFSGGRLGRGAAFRLLRRLDNQTLRRADAIVTLSQDMAETLAARGLGTLPLRIIENPPLETGAAIAPPAGLAKPEGRLRVIFAGNLGRFQNLPLLAEGIARRFAARPELELMFLGEGSALDELKARWEGHPQVRFAPFLPPAAAREVIAAADVGLVSLSPNIYRVAYPSKLATYLDLGLKVLALVEPESRLARALRRSGRGTVPAEATPEAVAAALEEVLHMPPPARPPQTRDHAASWRNLVGELEGAE